ncbi:MAG: hypothetical protein HY321_07685 [Armatimonadetes bacterium]|nr:hypothetical protein [Armatimonadota bacterium]
MRGSQYLAGEALAAGRRRWRSVKPPQSGCAKALLPKREVLWVEDVPGIAGRTGKLNGCSSGLETPVTLNNWMVRGILKLRAP